MTPSKVFIISFLLLWSLSNPCLASPLRMLVIDGGSDRKLECEEAKTKFRVTDAIFFCNGIRENTTDPYCLPTSSNGMLLFKNTPECDGHYSCWAFDDDDDDDDDALVLSEPVTVLGVPKAITTQVQTLLVCLGCSVNIPSNLHVSALDAQDVVWSRITQGAIIERVENAVINPDYSLILTDVGRGDAAIYFATATNTVGTKNGAQVELVVIKKPYIEGEINYTEGDGFVHFMIESCGDNLQYQWRINGSKQLIMSNTNNSITTAPLPLGTTHVSVNISNEIGSELRTVIIVNTSNTEVENSSGYTCFQKSVFVMVIVFFIIFLTSTILLLPCACYCTCKRARKQLQRASNKENGHYTKLLSYHHITETDDFQDDSKYEQVAKELRQLIMRKFDEGGWENNEPYMIFLHQLLLLSLDIQAKKKLPKKFRRVQYTKADAPQGEESYPEMDDLPPPFRAITHICCKELGISWNEDSDVSKLSSTLMAPPDDKSTESDPEVADNKNKSNNREETV